MASSSKSTGRYDVFLSFRGMDVRNNFASHLYNALVRIGIHTFRDSEELMKGRDISMLLKAIEESGIAIIIFSENYAFSRWCLKEVAKIMECKEQKGLTVLPVFYKVDPNEVREGRQGYQRALAKHESKFEEDLEQVKRWKKALFDAGSLSGWHLNDGDESKLIQGIVKEVSTRLDRAPLPVAKHPIGIECRVVELKAMLNLKSDDDVVMVGLWGQGGVGKTTLAKALYNSVFRQFEGSSFVADVRETSKGHRGLATLQETLLNDILLPQQKLEVSNVDGGINKIQHRLGHKKVLVILDDVDDRRQLDALVGEGNWFGDGSRIIVTTRDKHLLICCEINQDHIYEVEPLCYFEAGELLRNHASSRHHVLKIKADLVDGVLDLAKGLPLALEVLGSFLCGRSEEEWKSALDNFSRIPEEKLNDVLKISYDGLGANEKGIFLHIACFFKGWDSNYVKEVLDSCDFKALIGLQVLIERSLVRIEDGFLQMHDLIQLMGMDIVNRECKDPKGRSRLWLCDDVVNVLSHDMRDCRVEAIVLKPSEPTEIFIGDDAFTKMIRLKLLILGDVHNSFQGPICLPNDLRWFRWGGCASGIPEFSSVPKKLVRLDMRQSNIKIVPDQFKGFQNLKYMNFSGSKSLVCMPDISCTPNLVELDLHNCKNLIEAHESIAYHDKLQVLNLKKCSELSVFPNVLKSKNLRALNLEKCTKFERFPDIPHELKSLKEIHLGQTAIEGLPASMQNLVSLRSMDLGECKNLISLPSSIYKLQSLTHLGLWCCTSLIEFSRYKDSADLSTKTGLSKLKQLYLMGCNLSDTEFLDNPSCFPFLNYLDLSENNFTSLPTSINKRDHLSTLRVGNCCQLQEIPELPPFLRVLSALGCESLQNYGDLTSVHDFVRRALSMPGTSFCHESTVYTLILPGGEMPEWLLPVEEDSISFMVSQDLYDKFLGFALFINNGNDEPKIDNPYGISTYVNGKLCQNNRYLVSRGLGNNGSFSSRGSDPIIFDYFVASAWWGVVDFGEIDGSLVQFSLEVSGAKKWGVRIICKQLDDDLRRLISPALIYEVGHESTDSEAESSLMHKDSTMETDIQKKSEDCLMSTGKQSQIVSKRNQKLILPIRQETQMLTSNSTDSDENGSVGLQLLLLE